ncbi:MAG: galactose-1-epimerase, partial [Bacteroides sp.]|nr:galactose-1-epimerase [Bacteroides sp.]
MKILKAITAAASVALILSSCNHETQKTLTKSGLDADNFKTTVDGKDVSLYTLTNANGVEACITNYGGRLVSLMVPDKNGKFQDVVLGHDSIADYINIDGNFGALIGRYGNRINQGKFSINGVDY